MLFKKKEGGGRRFPGLGVREPEPWHGLDGPGSLSPRRSARRRGEIGGKAQGEIFLPRSPPRGKSIDATPGVYEEAFPLWASPLPPKRPRRCLARSENPFRGGATARDGGGRRGLALCSVLGGAFFRFDCQITPALEWSGGGAASMCAPRVPTGGSGPQPPVPGFLIRILFVVLEIGGRAWTPPPPRVSAPRPTFTRGGRTEVPFAA